MISIGIDVSKGRSKVCAVNHSGEVLISPHDVIHTKPYLNKLVQQIHTLNDECKAVLKATGHYHYPIVHSLRQNGIPSFCCQSSSYEKVQRGHHTKRKNG